MNRYLVLCSNSSRNGCTGLRPQARLMTDQAIIAAAEAELIPSGESLEGLAGIQWIEGADGNLAPARELSDVEALGIAIGKLSDDGRIFLMFSPDDEGFTDFVGACVWHGVSDEAVAHIRDLLFGVSATA